MVSARIDIGEYANKVLAVLKAKYGLKNKSEALNKFIELYGDDIVEKQATDDYVRAAMKTIDDHLKKYGQKEMSIQELDKLCGL
jgi:ribosomal protein S4